MQSGGSFPEIRTRAKTTAGTHFLSVDAREAKKIEKRKEKQQRG